MENIETLLAAVAQTQGFDDDPVVAPAQLPKVKNPDSRLGNSGGALPPIGEVPGNVPPLEVVGTHPPLPPTIGACVKRKRGRPPKVQAGAKPPPPKREKLEEEDEEDVCFICFDGGSLVLCDRKGCPKAYHPACIKRDEAFFASNAKWICGWHICSICMKGSHYMCYTCTYSLCKGCAKNTDYICVRGNKGFCSACMKTIMLIENKGQASNQPVQVDFDDKTSWEYLFKVYWVLLKEKLSLTFTELVQAKPPLKDVPAVAYNRQSTNGLRARIDGKVSISSMRIGHLELNNPSVETSLLQNDGFMTASSSIDKCVDKLNHNDAAGGPSNDNVNAKPMSDVESNPDRPITAKDENKQCIGNKKESEWASKDLLEFVAFVKNGDMSIMSQSDVQTLLLDYIKRYSLWDSNQKHQILCDQRLRNLFGKPRIGHIEMLKLLELHFCVKEDSQKNSLIPAGFVAGDLEADGKINKAKQKTKEKNEERAPQNNLIEYAAIDVHNIKLVYLRRDLMENLLEDQENFNNKVTGSIVRIRTTSLQKLDIYRLVQVVGTIKVAKPYKIGERAANVKLEVLNLDEKEVVSIDAISNEDFTEDECRRLHKSIRCGLVKHLTVGEVQKVAMALHTVRINYLLEAEILQLNHLQDQARKSRRKKELREYLERIELLKSPEERQRRLAEVPEIHTDPKMNLNYESEEEGNSRKKVELVHPSYTGLPRNGRNSISPNNRGKDHPFCSQNRVKLKMETSSTHDLGKPVDHQVNVTKSEVVSENDQAMQRTDLETLTTTASVEHSPSGNNIETEKLWHYRDPNGQIQGPFSMRHMRIWNTTGLLPPDMRIWTNHEQYDSVLLTDALIEDLHGGSESSCKHSLGSQENQTSGGNGESEGKHSLGSQENQTSGGNGESEGTNGTSGDSKQTEAVRSNHVSALSEKESGLAMENASDNSSWPQCWDLLNDKNSSADDVQANVQCQAADELNHGLQNGDKNSSADDVQANVQCQTADELNHDLQNGDKNSSAEDVQANVQCQAADELNHDSQNGDKKSNELTENQTSCGNELQNQCMNEGPAPRTTEENSRSMNIDLSSNLMVSESAAPVSNSLDLNKQIGNVDLSDLQSPNPTNAENHLPVSGVLELLSPPPRSNDEDVTKTRPSGTLSVPMLDSGPNWSGASNVVAGDVQLPDVGNVWCGYSSTPVKPSVIEWDSGLASAPLLKTEVMDEYQDASISDGHQISQAPPAQPPASNMANWLAILNEPIEFDALGEESVSDLLAEVDAMESQGATYSPNSAIKLAREFLEECKDDCFSSIEDFNLIPDPQRCDASGSPGEMQMTSQSSCNPIEAFDAFDSLSLKKSSVNSSAASSEGGTNTQVYSGDASSEFHPPAPSNPPQDVIGHATTATCSGSDPVDPSWGSVQGNINLVTVQGNVNLVLGGPAQGMANLSWGPNSGNTWVNPSINQSPRNGSLPWDGGQQQQQQRKYGAERYTSPRSSYQGSEPGFRRPPRGRQQGGYSGGGFSRAPQKGQRVCKFYESGHCKKGAFCDYLHP